MHQAFFNSLSLSAKKKSYLSTRFFSFQSVGLRSLGFLRRRLETLCEAKELMTPFTVFGGGNCFSDFSSKPTRFTDRVKC